MAKKKIPSKSELKELLTKISGVKKASDIEAPKFEGFDTVRGANGPIVVNESVAKIIKQSQPSMFVTNLLYLMRRDKIDYDQLEAKTIKVSPPGIPKNRLIQWVKQNAEQPTHNYREILARVFNIPNPQSLIDDDLQTVEREISAQTWQVKSLNPVIDDVMASHPDIFRGWTERDFDWLRSIRGHGGALTQEGVLNFAHRHNIDRQILEKTRELLHSEKREVIHSVIMSLWESLRSHDSLPRNAADEARTS